MQEGALLLDGDKIVIRVPELVSEGAGPAENGKIIDKDARFITLDCVATGPLLLPHARSGVDPVFRERPAGKRAKFRAERRELLDDEVARGVKGPGSRLRYRRQQVVSGQTGQAKQPRLGPQVAAVHRKRFLQRREHRVERDAVNRISVERRVERSGPAAAPSERQLLSLDPVERAGQRHRQGAPALGARLVGTAADIPIRVEGQIVDFAQRELAHFSIELDLDCRQRHQLIAQRHPGCRAGRGQGGGQVFLSGAHEVLGAALQAAQGGVVLASDRRGRDDRGDVERGRPRLESRRQAREVDQDSAPFTRSGLRGFVRDIRGGQTTEIAIEA